MIEDTVRIAVEGAAIATNVRAGIDAPSGAAAPEETSELREAKRLAAVETRNLARLSVALEALTGSQILADDPSDDPPAAWAAIVAARRAMLALRTERELALRAEYGEAERRERKARERLTAALDRDRLEGSARAAKPHELRKQIDVELVGEGAITLHVEYVVGAARWAPSYVARIDGTKASLEIRAVVAQATGEDWTAAKLQLSTAEPARFAQLPELAAQRIGRKQAEPARAGFRAPPTGAATLYADYLRHVAAMRPPVYQEPEEVTIRGDDRPAPTNRPMAKTEAERDEPMPLMDQLEEATDEGGAYDAVVSRNMRGRAQSFAEENWDEESSAAKEAFATPPRGSPMPSTPMPSMARLAPQDRAESKKSLGGHAGGMPAQSAPPAPQPRLDYGRLVMADPDASQRGSLIQAPHDPSRGEVDAAAARADAAIELLVLPSGCFATWSHTYDYSYATDGAVDVKSDSGWHSIAVTQTTVTVALHHVAVPREQPDVFRIATLVNGFAGPLLPGPIDVYDRGKFLVTSNVELTPPGAKLEIGLGVDAAVKIARNTEFREEAAGMLRGSLKLLHALTIDVDNVSGNPIDIEVRERLPVTREGEDDIEVTPGRVEPAWEAWKPHPDGPHAARLRGGYRWRVAVPAGQKRTLRAAYEIKIPSKAELVGGNRRES